MPLVSLKKGNTSFSNKFVLIHSDKNGDAWVIFETTIEAAAAQLASKLCIESECAEILSSNPMPLVDWMTDVCIKYQLCLRIYSGDGEVLFYKPKRKSNGL